jgi:adiponectin receptor
MWTSYTIFSFFSSSIPSASAAVIDTPILAFTIFALFTLFSSVVWHTMAGCAHHRGMTLCAKFDYVGIAWCVHVLIQRLPAFDSFSHILHDRLISGSVGTIIYYGFQCNTNARGIFLIGCLLNGIAGTVIPFWDWFDRAENKVFVFSSFSSSSISLKTRVP